MAESLDWDWGRGGKSELFDLLPSLFSLSLERADFHRKRRLTLTLSFRISDLMSPSSVEVSGSTSLLAKGLKVEGEEELELS